MTSNPDRLEVGDWIIFYGENPDLGPAGYYYATIVAVVGRTASVRPDNGRRSKARSGLFTVLLGEVQMVIYYLPQDIL